MANIPVKIKKFHGEKELDMNNQINNKVPPNHIEDIRGRRYGRLTVISFAGILKTKSRWVCRCDCGTHTVVTRGGLTSGTTKSCGCLKREVASTHRSSVYTTCDYCGKSIRVKKSQYLRTKHHYCDMECMGKHRKTLYRGEGNHQYGLKGEKNSSFKGVNLTRKNNSLIEDMIYVGGWYKCTSYKGRVPKHRFVVEENWDKYNPDFFDEIEGWHYIKQGYEVHHIDLCHTNNSLDNLALLTKAEHVTLHNKIRNQKRDTNRRDKQQ